MNFPEPVARALDWVLSEGASPPPPPRQRRRRFGLRRRPSAALALALSVILIGSLWWAVPSIREALGPPGSPAADAAPVGDDPVQRRALSELGHFTDWLQDNHVQGYIGEVGISNSDDRWLQLAKKWFRAADRAGLWVDVWSTGEWWGEDYDYSPFVIKNNDGPVAAIRPAGRFLAEEARRLREPVGVNVSGGEFGAPAGYDEVSAFSNKNPGTYDQDYHYDGQKTFDYLASQGMKTVRVPFRWERIQPTLGGDLDATELTRLRRVVQQADKAGLGVILDVHNFGAYHLDDGGQGVRRAIGSPEVSQQMFADLWSRLSAAFAGRPGVLAYDLMNEPVNLPSVAGMEPAKVWEAASQAAVDAIRARGDKTLIMIPGYDWSHPKDFAQNHPWAWIVDPANNIRYTAHQYWRSGFDSYDKAAQDAVADGF